MYTSHMTCFMHLLPPSPPPGEEAQVLDARERVRQSSPDAPPAPWPVKVAYLSLCWVLDGLYAGRPIQRFWFLETVARMPYFSYISMLHLYESLGWWRAGAGARSQPRSGSMRSAGSQDHSCGSGRFSRC